MLLYIIRHGVTEWNRLSKVQGIADIPLAKEGLDLAVKTGEALKHVNFDLCYTSPLIRARQTAEAVIAGRDIPLIPDTRIQEINFGVLEGSVFRDENRRVVTPEMEIFFAHPLEYQRPKDGENIADILKRTKEFWDEITTDEALADKTILIASHGCAVRALLQNMYQDLSDFWHGHVPPNCGVNVVEIRDGKAVFLEEDKVYA